MGLIDTGILDIVQKLLGQVSLNHWTVSHNGQRKGPILDAHTGLKNGTTFWARFKFTEDGKDHTLTGERPIQGGDSTITLDDAAVTGGQITLSKHFKFPLHLSVEV